MKTMLSLLVALFLAANVHAQDAYCGLSKLFLLPTSSTKEAIIDSIKNYYKIEPLYNRNATTHSKKTEAKELLIYKLQNNNCFQGNNTKIQFEFINNKLVNAFIQTEFARADYYALTDNMTYLRQLLKQNWHREKETKSTSDNLVSTGFVYSKAKDANTKVENILLHFISTKPGKGYGIYLLQLNWINNNSNYIQEIVY
jgi:hypothetical protein